MALEDEGSPELSPRVAPTKPFDCDNCNSEGFNTIGAKRRHIREEHGPPKYWCNYCGQPTKRRYQMTRHKSEAHPGAQASSTTNLASNEDFNHPIDSRSSDEVVASSVRPSYRPSSERSPTAQKLYSTFNGNQTGSEAYNAWNVDISQNPVRTQYASNTPAAPFYGNKSLPLSISQHKTPPSVFQSPYSTTPPNFSLEQSNTAQWGPTRGTSKSTACDSQFDESSTMGPTHQPDRAVSPQAPRYSGDIYDMSSNSSPYTSPSSEQGSLFSQSSGSAYTWEAGRQDDWSPEPPTRPQ